MTMKLASKLDMPLSKRLMKKKINFVTKIYIGIIIKNLDKYFKLLMISIFLIEHNIF